MMGNNGQNREVYRQQAQSHLGSVVNTNNSIMVNGQSLLNIGVGNNGDTNPFGSFGAPGMGSARNN